jgi:hypothetical protein
MVRRDALRMLLAVVLLLPYFFMAYHQDGFPSVFYWLEYSLHPTVAFIVGTIPLVMTAAGVLMIIVFG